MLKACVNGARGKKDHPALPVTATELARDVAAVVAAGAAAVHLHVKDDQGADTFDGSAMADVMSAVQRAAPGVPVGVTTGAWALPDPAERIAAIQSWGRLPVRPDFASVNWHEDGAEEVAAALLDIGIAVEAGLWHVGGAQSWLASPHRDRCLRVLLELPDGLGPAAIEDQVARLLRLVGSSTFGDDEGLAVVLHGEGETAWPALQLAARLGLSTRIGLEDVLSMPDGATAVDNAALVGLARDLLAGASFASPS